MGLIMLILIGTVPAAYALNHAFSAQDMQALVAVSEQADHILGRYADPAGIPSPGTPSPDPRTEVTGYIGSEHLQPDTVLAVRKLGEDVSR